MQYYVDCVRDEEHGETFAISSVEKGTLQELLGYLTEAKLRMELSNRRVSMEEIEIAIRQARERADLKEQGEVAGS